MLHFSIVFSIRHHTLEPAFFTQGLEIEPSHTQKSGGKVKTPKGNFVGGVYQETRWTYVKKFESDKKIQVEFLNMLNFLAKKSEFLNEIYRNDGSMQIFINLPGQHNQGFSFDVSTLKILCDLNICLGFEVFPNSRATL